MNSNEAKSNDMLVGRGNKCIHLRLSFTYARVLGNELREVIYDKCHRFKLHRKDD